MKFVTKPISYENLKSVIDFLSHKEKTCITLMSRFIQKGDICLLPNHIKGYAFYYENKLVGILAISEGGIVLHHFDEKYLNKDFKHKSDLEKLIFPILSRHYIYSIIGDMEGTDFLCKIIDCEKKPKIKISYTLMTFNESQNQDNISKKDLPNNFQLKKCNSEDTEKLYSLQAAYDVVEVLPPDEEFNPENCRLNLRHNLINQYIIGIWDSSANCFVAKAGTNAQGQNWVQLGGVFTKETSRGKGLATFMVKKLATIMKEKQKNVALFVKDTNDFAKKAYLKAGFLPDSKFCICYY